MSIGEFTCSEFTCSVNTSGRIVTVTFCEVSSAITVVTRKIDSANSVSLFIVFSSCKLLVQLLL